MTKRELARFCDEWLAAWTGNRPETLRTFYTEDAFYSDPARPQGLRGPELLPYFQRLLTKNPDWTWTREELLEIPKGFCVKWRSRIPNGGRVVELTGLDLVELRRGKIFRNEVYFDRSPILMR